jgi:hypothetical protein
MGGQQAYTMAALYPEFVENMICLAGSARTSSHNWCVLEALKHLLMHSEDFKDGLYIEQATKGLTAFDTVYSPGLSLKNFLESAGKNLVLRFWRSIWLNSGVEVMMRIICSLCCGRGSVVILCFCIRKIMGSW